MFVSSYSRSNRAVKKFRVIKTLVVVVKLDRSVYVCVGGGWVIKHLLLFSRPSPSPKRLRNRERRDNNGVIDRWVWFFVVQQASRGPFLSGDFECRHRNETTMAPLLKLNYRILPEYGVITRFSRLTVTTQNEKIWTVAIQFPGNSLDIVEARQSLEISNTSFKVRTENFVCKFLIPFQDIIALYFIATKLTYGRLLVLFAAALMGHQSF